MNKVVAKLKSRSITSGEVLAEFDDIFEQSEKRVDFRIKQNLVKQRQHMSQYTSPARLNLERIEQAVRSEFRSDRQKRPEDVMEIKNKALLVNEAATQCEKMKGRFNLVINKKLPKQTQINRFSSEPIAFHLYKSRFFFEKLDKH